MDPEIPLYTCSAHGGTLAIWHKKLDPYIEAVPTNTTAFLPVILKIPGLKTSIHVTLYLPTHSKDDEFIADMAELRNCLDDLITKYPDPVLFVRGDGNVNRKNKARIVLLHQLLRDFNLARTDIGHNTYHHFVGNGMYDSDIDLLLHSQEESVAESVIEVICKNNNPAVLSHHDPILSTFSLPPCMVPKSSCKNITAPKLDYTRTKIEWSEKGKLDYSELVQPLLRQARDRWCDPGSQISMSVLLSLTSNILSKCATQTNKFKEVGAGSTIKSKRCPKAIQLVKNKLNKAHRRYKDAEKLKYKDIESHREAFKVAKKKYQQLIRKHRLYSNIKRYSNLDMMFSNPASAHAYIRSCKKSQPRKIELLRVGDLEYQGSNVCDGFYHSMTTLKQCDISKLREEQPLSDQFINYDIIIQLCRKKAPIPPISIANSTKILESMKKNVSDYYSVTALHYLYAGQEGLLHYHHILNALISDVNNSAIEELNVAHGNILYKGHRKDKNSDRSYRTISSCPFLAKSIDYYLRSLYHTCWDNSQATTQYQGTGSSHELASLLVTEVLQYSLYVSSKPVFLLALDAQSAFDLCLRQILCSEMFKAGVSASAILFMDTRLRSRRTVYEWDGVKMGPSEDITGFEQGGVNSSDYYKLYNNEQLAVAQDSALGADMGSSIISAVGQADDVILLSNEIYSLQLLVTLTEEYCRKYRVKLEPKKTKLLGFYNKSSETLVKLAEKMGGITLNKVKVEFSSQAEHVGVIRSCDGNLPNLLNRISAHKKSLGSVLSAGLARGHRGSPAAALRVHQLHCLPVLFNGLASLVLSKGEIKMIDSHYQVTIQNLQRLHSRTPRPIVFFLAGTLPGEAVLHMRQLALFSMICHLQGDPLQKHGIYVLSTLPKSSHSWFHQVRDLCLQYCLPHPLELLEYPVQKAQFKKLVKLKVTEYWQYVLATECSSLKSLRYFCPQKASLTRPHPMWSTTVGNCFESSKSTVLARMVSGRYRTERMCRFWSSNRHGYCLLETCHNVFEDLEHLLICCPALEDSRQKLHSLWYTKTVQCPPLYQLITSILRSSPSIQTKFILDSSSFPELISLRQMLGNEIQEITMYLTRTWAFTIHKQKLQKLGRWPGGKHDMRDNISTNQGPPTQKPIPIVPNQTNIYHFTGHVIASSEPTRELPKGGVQPAVLCVGDQCLHQSSLDKSLGNITSPCASSESTSEDPAVQCEGDQCNHQFVSMDSPCNTCMYRPAPVPYSEYYPDRLPSTDTGRCNGLSVESVGCTDSQCGGADIGGMDKPVQSFNLPKHYSLATNQVEGPTSSPPQSDLPSSYLQQPVRGNPSYGVPVTSVVRAGGAVGGLVVEKCV